MVKMNRVCIAAWAYCIGRMKPNQFWVVRGCFRLMHQPFTSMLPWVWRLYLFLHCPQGSSHFGLCYYKYLNPGGREIALESLCVLEKASHVPSVSRHWCQPGCDVLCSPCAMFQKTRPFKKTRIQCLLDRIQEITLFIISRESAFLRAAGLLKLPWAGWTPWEWAPSPPVCHATHPDLNFFLL